MSTPPPTLEYRTPPPGSKQPDWRWLRQALAPLGAGFVIGVLIWAISPKAEAWDSPYYIFALFGGGFIAACFGPRRFWAAPVGIYLGQVCYVALAVAAGWLEGGPLWILGLAVGTVFATLALAGAALALLIFHVAGFGHPPNHR
jgi:hypothetical protein